MTTDNGTQPEPQAQPQPQPQPQPQSQQLIGIAPAFRERILRLLDRLPRGDVNDIYMALEQAPILNVQSEPK